MLECYGLMHIDSEAVYLQIVDRYEQDREVCAIALSTESAFRLGFKLAWNANGEVQTHAGPVVLHERVTMVVFGVFDCTAGRGRHFALTKDNARDLGNRLLDWAAG